MLVILRFILRRQLLKGRARPSRRVAEARDPERDRTPADYAGTVADWRHRRSEVTEALIRDNQREDERNAP